MFHHRKYTILQRAVLALREVVHMTGATAQGRIRCPGCGKNSATGTRDSWICHACGSQSQT